MRPWTFSVTCPHGIVVDAPFDALGYARGDGLKCPDSALHRDIAKVLEPVPPSRFRVWWQVRKARRSLEGGHPWQ